MSIDPSVTPSGAGGRDPVALARSIADEVLFPAALEIDRSVVVPSRYLDVLASAGLYGLFAPVEVGGFDADPITAARVIEALAGASFTTAFVWVQHHSAVRALAGARPELREQWLAPLCSGRLRAGVASAALRRPGPPSMTARRVEGGWLLTGSAPWVTGWDRVGVVLVAARAGDDLVWALVDALPSTTLTAHPLPLAVAGASSTVEMRLHGHPAADARVAIVEPVAAWRARDLKDLRRNGYLAVGVAARCARLLDSRELTDSVDAARQALDDAPEDDLVEVRSAASLLAVRAGTALVANTGGRAMGLDDDAQRLARDAMFLVVFGQTLAIRAAQVARLAGPGAALWPDR